MSNDDIMNESAGYAAGRCIRRHNPHSRINAGPGGLTRAESGLTNLASSCLPHCRRCTRPRASFSPSVRAGIVFWLFGSPALVVSTAFRRVFLLFVLDAACSGSGTASKYAIVCSGKQLICRGLSSLHIVRLGTARFSA